MAEETGDLTAQAEETLATEETTPARPDWLPDQYADEKAFASAHKEAQRKISEQGSELARMREEMESLSELVQEQPAQGQQFADPNQNPFVLAYQRAVEDNDIPAQMAIQAQLMDTVVSQRLEAQTKQSGQDRRGLDPHLVQREGEQIAAKYGNDEALTAKAYELMETHPLLSRRVSEIDKDPNATMGDIAAVVETAYDLAKGGIVQNQHEQSLAQQQLEAERAKERKLGQESLSGTGGRVASQNEQEQAWERIQAAKSTGLRIG